VFNYGKIVPDDNMTFLLGVTFSIICPLIAPIAAIYYGMRYLANKYMLVYRAEENYQSGGKVWLRAYSQYITGLVMFHVVMICLLALKEMIGPPIIVLPLPFITLVVASSTMKKYEAPMHRMSLIGASNRDEEDEHLKDSMEGGAYLSPSFFFDDEDHYEVISQCELLKDAQAKSDYSRLKELLSNSDVPAEDVEKQA